MKGIIRKIRLYVSEFKIRKNKTPYGEIWQEKSGSIITDFYDSIFEDRPLLHANFVDFVKNKKDCKTALEVGCGAGAYPIKFKEMFSGMEYTGIDFSKSSIEFCKKNSEYKFLSDDFIKMDLPDKYDLVFSHAVIDHVYDPDRFLEKIVNACKKYAYVSAYRGYFPELMQHKMKWVNRLGCYHNSLSVNQLKRVLQKSGLDADEFTIREQENGRNDFMKSKTETVIEIHRKQIEK